MIVPPVGRTFSRAVPALGTPPAGVSKDRRAAADAERQGECGMIDPRKKTRRLVRA